MELSRLIINSNQNKHLWLKDLNYLLDRIDIKNDDDYELTMECCKSFLESIFKNIVKILDQTKTEKDISETDFHRLVKCVKDLFLEHEKIKNMMGGQEFELFFSALGNSAKFLSEIRNRIGEVSHGKVYPKHYELDRNTAIFIEKMTDAFSFFVINLFLQIDTTYINRYKYEDYLDFNNYLDDLTPMGGVVLYSRALYDQDYDAYAEELDNYKDMIKV